MTKHSEKALRINHSLKAHFIIIVVVVVVVVVLIVAAEGSV